MYFFKICADILFDHGFDSVFLENLHASGVFTRSFNLKATGCKTTLQCLVYQFRYDLCDAGYVGFTRRQLHHRVDEHKNPSSSFGKHFWEKHLLAPKDLSKNFPV